MKIFLDDFIVYNNMETHLDKLRLCFLKCYEFGISLDIDKCAFMVLSCLILGFIVSKDGKLPYPRKIHVIVNMKNPTSLHKSKYLNGTAQFYKCFITNFVLIVELITKLMLQFESFV
jgi:hypothetical protein